jgi:peroxiredoxin Q/BCP
MMRMRTVVVVLIVVVAFVFAFRQMVRADSDPMPAVGQAAPDFTLPSQENTAVSLHDYRGKWVVLYFYPKDMTSGCTVEAHNFQRDLKQYDALNAVVLGVSVDTPDSHKQFCTKDGLTFKLLADPDKKVVKQYGSLMMIGFAARNTFLIDPQGKIVKVWTKVDPQGHSAEVLSAIKTAESAKG